MNEQEIITDIKKNSYWRVLIEPSELKQERLTLQECEQAVSECQVKKRGWFYPYVYKESHIEGDGFLTNDYATNMIAFKHKREIWRMYKSGQFIHYVASKEDWNEIYLEYFKDRKVLDVINSVYFLTEIFLFISNLVTTGIYEKDVWLTVELFGVYNRDLTFYPDPSQPFRELHGTYKCRFIGPIRIERRIQQDQIVSSVSDLAMDAAEELFNKFNWKSTQIKEIFRNYQENLVKGLI